MSGRPALLCSLFGIHFIRLKPFQPSIHAERLVTPIYWSTYLAMKSKAEEEEIKETSNIAGTRYCSSASQYPLSTDHTTNEMKGPKSRNAIVSKTAVDSDVSSTEN